MSENFPSDFDEAADRAQRVSEQRQAAEWEEEAMRLFRRSLDVREEENSALVQAVMEVANRESDAAIEEFLFCDPNDVALVKRLQWRALRPRMIAGWLKEVLDKGEAAEQRLEQAKYAENLPPE